jgi:hypothetical protein
MASCKDHSECTGQQVCSDGQCVDIETPEPREVRRTFATATGEYMGAIAGEQAQLEAFGRFLNEELDEAAKKREEQAESSDFWGTLLSAVGGIGGFLLSGNPILGAVIYSSIGSGIGRGGADWVNDAESYGLTDAEMESLDPAELKYLKGTHEQLIYDAQKLQDNLDDYDDNEWKAHVMGIIGDTWNAYQFATFGEGLGLDQMFSKGATEKAKTITSPSIDPTTSGQSFFSQQYGQNLQTSLNKPLMIDFPGLGWSNQEIPE